MLYILLPLVLQLLLIYPFDQQLLLVEQGVSLRLNDLAQLAQLGADLLYLVLVDAEKQVIGFAFLFNSVVDGVLGFLRVLCFEVQVFHLLHQALLLHS